MLVSSATAGKVRIRICPTRMMLVNLQRFVSGGYPRDFGKNFKKGYLWYDNQVTNALHSIALQ